MPINIKINVAIKNMVSFLFCGFMYFWYKDRPNKKLIVRNVAQNSGFPIVPMDFDCWVISDVEMMCPN